jgi:uncharacterized membrane protein (DUF2068 family)
MLALSYAIIRLVEAYGLWNEKEWAEWFATISGGVYIPFELYEFIKDFSVLTFTVLVVNSLVILVMINTLHRRLKAKTSNIK